MICYGKPPLIKDIISYPILVKLCLPVKLFQNVEACF